MTHKIESLTLEPDDSKIEPPTLDPDHAKIESPTEVESDD